MPGVSKRMLPKKLWPVAVLACFTAAACVSEPAKQAYRDSSDWLNDVPDPPADGPWRLSKRIEPTDLAYPNLGDVPDRPADLAVEQDRDRELLEFEQTSAGTALKLPPEDRATAAELGAPAPAALAPLSIPAAK